MPLADAISVAERNGMYQGGSLQNDVANRMVKAMGDMAERKARDVISDDKYDDIDSNQTSGDEEWDQLKEAESFLIFGMALKRMNLRMTKKGGAVRRTGTVDNENDLMSAAEIESYADEAYGNGLRILEDHVADEEEQEASVVYTL